jgi:Flp pilus assembly protein TadG
MGESRSPRLSGRGRGQILVLSVIALPAFIGSLGLATDIGNYFLNYERLQTAADASVLSGAEYLPNQPCAAISLANIYATCLNGVASTEVVSTTTSYGTVCPAPASTPVPVTCATTTVAPTGCSPPRPPPSAEPSCNLTIQLQRTVPYFFGRLVGVNSGTVNAIATATIPETTGLGSINNGLVPIGLQYTTVYSTGAATTLLFKPNPTGAIPAGYWSALALGGRSFTSIFDTGYNAKVSLNDAIAPDKSATTAGPVSAAIQARINAGLSADSSGSPVPPPTYTANDLRAVTVVLVDWGATGGCCSVKGFAEVFMDSVSNGNVTAYWIANGVNGSPDLTGTAPIDGALAITLTQ